MEKVIYVPTLFKDEPPKDCGCEYFVRFWVGGGEYTDIIYFDMEKEDWFFRPSLPHPRMKASKRNIYGLEWLKPTTLSQLTTEQGGEG